MRTEVFIHTAPLAYPVTPSPTNLFTEFSKISWFRFVSHFARLACSAKAEWVIEVTFHSLKYFMPILGILDHFYFKFLVDICPLWCHWHPCFEFLMRYYLDFKVTAGSFIRTWSSLEHISHSMGPLIPFCWTSGDVLGSLICSWQRHMGHVPWDSPQIWHLMIVGAPLCDQAH